jgi:hypothetical protein
MGHRRIERYTIPYERNTYYYHRQKPVTNVYVYNNVRYDRGPRRENGDYRSNGNGSRPEYKRQESQPREYNRQRNNGRRNDSRLSDDKRENKPRRKFENPGHRNRLLKAEAAR